MTPVRSCFLLTPKPFLLAACLFLSREWDLPAQAAEQETGITLAVRNAEGKVLSSTNAAERVRMDYAASYTNGDAIVVTASSPFLVVQVDPAIPETLVYAPEGHMTFPIPWDLERVSGYPPEAFGGATHPIQARIATPAERSAYRNVALNPLDKRGQSEYFPHAAANIVTRNEPQFYERNAIDGNTQNTHHGKWPYESWGTGQRPDPVLKVDFGREVEVDKVRIFLRCDFPHDSYWNSLALRFPDGTLIEAPLQKTAEGQEITFPKKSVSWIQLEQFKQPVTPLGWAALSEVEVYGRDPEKRPEHPQSTATH
jgi:hypothetical protein